jgi:hypothetical protein
MARPSFAISPEMRLTVQPSNLSSALSFTRPDNKEVRRKQGVGNGPAHPDRRLWREFKEAIMSAVVEEPVPSAIRVRARSRFYSNFAIVIAVFLIGAFARTYYLRFLSGLPPLSQTLHVHGIVSTAWIVLFVAQTRLIAARRVDLHMKLGIAGLVLAIAVIVVGVMTTALTAAVPHIRPSGLTSSQFTAIPLTSLALFAAFIGIALALRRRADFHKRFMVLAMISVLSPGVGRVVQLLDIRPFAFYVQTAVILAFVGWCLAHDWRQHRLVHPVFAYGGAFMIASWPLRHALARSEMWIPVADAMHRLGVRML